MATFVPDYGQTPSELMKALFLHDNPDLAEYTITFSNPVKDVVDATKTKATASIAENVVDIKEALIKYTRISLPVLFSLVPLEVHGVHFEGAEIKPVEANQYILDNYGLNVSEDFQYRKDESSGVWYLKSADANLAFQDEVEIKRIASLGDRIPVNVLEGFFLNIENPFPLNTMRLRGKANDYYTLTPLYNLTITDGIQPCNAFFTIGEDQFIVEQDTTWTEESGNTAEMVISDIDINTGNKVEIDRQSQPTYLDSLNGQANFMIIPNDTDDIVYLWTDAGGWGDSMVIQQELWKFDVKTRRVSFLHTIPTAKIGALTPVAGGYLKGTKLFFNKVGVNDTTGHILDISDDSLSTWNAFPNGGIMGPRTYFTANGVMTFGDAGDNKYYQYDYAGNILSKVASPKPHIKAATIQKGGEGNRLISMDKSGGIHIVDFDFGEVQVLTNIIETQQDVVLDAKNPADIKVYTTERGKLNIYEFVNVPN